MPVTQHRLFHSGLFFFPVGCFAYLRLRERKREMLRSNIGRTDCARARHCSKFLPGQSDCFIFPVARMRRVGSLHPPTSLSLMQTRLLFLMKLPKCLPLKQMEGGALPHRVLIHQSEPRDGGAYCSACSLCVRLRSKIIFSAAPSPSDEYGFSDAFVQNKSGISINRSIREHLLPQ